MRLFYLLFAIVLLTPWAIGISSMGVRPPVETIVYVGQKTITGKFVVFPGEEKNIKVYASGSLKDYVYFRGNETELRMRISGATEIFYELRLPEQLSPGDHRIHLVCEEYLTPEELIEMGGFARAFAAIGHIVKVRVPNEGKFLETSIETEPDRIDAGEIVYFVVNMLNLGTEDLKGLAADVTVRSPEEEVLSQKQTKTIDLLKPGQSDRLISYWDTKGYSSGVYTAKAIIDYGGDYVAEPETEFKVGDIFIEILSVDTELNESVGRFIIEVESNWNDAIENVYAEVIIKKENSIVDTLRSSSINLASWGKDKLIAYWPRKSLSAGEYDVEIFVYYYDKQAQKQMKVSLSTLEQKSPENTINKFLIITIVLLAVILTVNIVWVIVSLKRSGKKK